MIRLLCDHCGTSSPLREAPGQWVLLHYGRHEFHFCTIDCVLFWGARVEETT